VGKKKVLFVYPRLEMSHGFMDVFVFRRMFPLGIHALASLTPPDWDVRIIDENIEPLNFDAKPDPNLVAISSLTPSAPRAYEISQEFRKRGVKTIIGGPHVSFMTEEALRFADSVAFREADEIWPQILADAASGKLRRIYAPEPPRLASTGKDEFISEIPYKFPGFRVPIVQTGRGCPGGCDYCQAWLMNGKTVRHRPVEAVVKAIENFFRNRQSMRKFMIFIDDNIVADKAYAKALFTEMRRLKVKWLCLTDIRIASDDILDLAVKSGLIGAYIGFEAVDDNALSEISPVKARWRKQYEEAIGRLHDSGVMVEGSFIFGADAHTPDVFKRTVDWAIENAVDIAQFSVLTPFPGTNLFQRLLLQNRITALKKNGEVDWRRFTGSEVVFRPLKLTPEELKGGLEYAHRAFYSFASIVSRFERWGREHREGSCNFLTLFANFDFKRMRL